MRTREQGVEPYINLSEITEIELLILKRMRELTMGEHRSQVHGPGFNLVGLRDWQAGDRLSSIDWAQSTLNNFSPLVVREFEQPSNATVVVVADGSLSTRCGTRGLPIAAIIARAIATIGMSAVFFQDRFGLITFNSQFSELAAVPARIGKNQVIHCLDAYQQQRGLEQMPQAGSISRSIAGLMRKTSLIPIVSDFLFDNPREVILELSRLNSVHDVFLVLIDSGFAFDLPSISAGWVEAFDVETGRSRLMSRDAFGKLAQRARDWQDEIERLAKNFDLDLLRLGRDEQQSAVALTEFVAERRLRKT
jgi:uncharacterized protein (DUF58 family)